MADIAASVPELVNLIFSINRWFEIIKSANSFSSLVGAPKEVPLPMASITFSRTAGWLWPKIRGPQEQQKSINSLPSASHSLQPSPLSINMGVPPTDLNARTGEFTPPGNKVFAFSKSDFEFSRFNI